MILLQPFWWIRDIDWRLSAGVIFSLQLVVWGWEDKRRSYWRARMAVSAVLLCGAAWVMRYFLEVWIANRVADAFGYAVYLLVLGLLFIFCYLFCYRTSRSSAVYIGILALTIYRMCWDAVKLVSCIPVDPGASWTEGSILQSVLSYFLYVLIILSCRNVHDRIVSRQITFPLRATTILYGVVLFSQMLLEFTYQIFTLEDESGQVLYFMSALFYSLMSFALMIALEYMALLQEDNTSMQDFIHSNQRYYEISRDGILSLQIKCHDLKHQIGRIRSAEGQREMEEYMKGLEDSIDEYNTVIDCGNKDIDVVLTEKNIICLTSGIRFTYIIDGSLFSFLTDLEIYSLFGNATDNALEAMQEVEYPEKRYMMLKAAQREDWVILVIENYSESEVKFENGLPVTTKEDTSSHGFGLRSIEEIAESHGGGISVETEDQAFRLTVTMRRQAGQETET